MSSRVKRCVRWSLPILALLALLALVFSLHYFPTRPMSVAASTPGADSGRAALHSSDLAAMARRTKVLQDQLASLRQQLESVQAEATLQRDHAATLDSMLTSNMLTQTPLFLQDETTIRALQGVIREAAGPEGPGKGTEGNLGTAATIARERLRPKLETIRDGLDQQASKLEVKCDDLRERMHATATEIEEIQGRINARLGAQGAPGK